jgi:xylulokinase
MAQIKTAKTDKTWSILGVDIGTTSLKMGVFQIADDALNLIRESRQEYQVNIYNDGLFGDIEQDKWKKAFVAGCQAIEDVVGQVDIVSLSGTTPGLTVMDRDGQALYPAILMLDQRSRKQAKLIIETIGMEHLLATTANMPVAGGCSLAGILWIKENYPDIFKKAHKFGHSNTYFAHWLTGAFAIDPSSASLTALYNTVRNDLTWNQDIAGAFDISPDRLSQIIRACDSVGRMRKPLAQELGFTKEPPVLIGGNDAVLAAYSVGINEPGEIINVNGTCEVTLVCLGRCVSSTNYNIRAHVLPDRWLTLHVMNAGGKALEWFRCLFCSELSDDRFYNQFLPEAIDAWLDRESDATYVPYLMGSRYSQEPLKAQLLGLTQQTERQEILAAIVRGLCEYQKTHLTEIAKEVCLQNVIHATGGALNATLLKARKKWMRDCQYVHEQQSSMKGAALLGLKYIENL